MKEEQRLADAIRSYLELRPEASHVEARRENAIMTLRFWSRTGRLIFETTRLLIALSLPACSVLAGLDDYEAPPPPNVSPPFTELPDAHMAQDTGTDTGVGLDGANDAISQDVALDENADTSPDVVHDAGADALTDALFDALADTSVDSPADAPADAAPDVAPDAPPDAAPDAAPDASPDTGSSDAAPEACTGQPLMHKNGFGGAYWDCIALGSPGTPSTYTYGMAIEASASYSLNGATYFDAVCGTDHVYGKTNTAICVVWSYSGASAGFAARQTVVDTDGGDPCVNLCPNPSTDPTWN